MAIKTQRWRPDTCQCWIEQTYDSADYEGTVVNTVSRVCAFHEGLSAVERPVAAVEQNKRKNKLYRHLMENFRDDLFTQEAESGSYVLKSGATFNWSYSGVGADRVLTVTIAGLSNQKKALAQTWCDTNIGSGKVVVQ